MEAQIAQQRIHTKTWWISHNHHNANAKSTAIPARTPLLSASTFVALLGKLVLLAPLAVTVLTPPPPPPAVGSNPVGTGPLSVGCSPPSEESSPGESAARPIDGGEYRYTEYTFFCIISDARGSQPLGLHKRTKIRTGRVRTRNTSPKIHLGVSPGSVPTAPIHVSSSCAFPRMKSTSLIAQSLPPKLNETLGMSLHGKSHWPSKSPVPRLAPGMAA